MSGRRSVVSRLEVLETRAIQRAKKSGSRYRVDLSQLTDTEVEALAVLAEKAEAAGGHPEWTPEEEALLTELNTRVVVIPEVTA